MGLPSNSAKVNHESIRSDDVSEVISTEVSMAKGTYRSKQRTVTTTKSNEEDALNGRGNDEPKIQAKSKVSENEKMTISQEKVSKLPVLHYIPLCRRVTYQRAMQGNFDDMLHKHVECYVDNLIVKSKKKCDHLKDLELVLDCLKKYQLRMHPLKCAFSVTSGKFIEFIVRHRGIEVENSKIDAIQKMSSSKNLHELRHYRLKKACLEHYSHKKNDKGKECALYYLNRLRHYMQAFTIHLVGKVDRVKYILSRPAISGYLAKWTIILQQYDVVYISHKVVKGQTLADFLADHSFPSNWKLCEDLPHEEVLFVESMEPWAMFFDGAVRRSEVGVDIVVIFHEKHMLPYNFTLSELCSNNVVEYQELITPN
ncbi:uncharacterized protein E5676_scaffold1738G00700 [Cucumis melo var. makuwa]|uniref:Reverse transcriptase domain-containing protein n=1 Tax=Cucumis melo var. makuwa TaxID=1194695 RepID=A0A5D3BUH1_CUCMM|nr:uncharacterized protein E5676_scaffold1738G00700 [Cucumis melo var. makuwa]